MDHAGTLEREIGFAFRFDAPGVHHIAVELSGPNGEQTIDLPVIVNDPQAVRILSQRSLIDPNSDDGEFEGLTMDRSGRFLYVGDFENSLIYQVDPATLQVLGGPLPLPSPSPPFGRAEGLSVTPYDSLLIVAHKHQGLSTVAIPAMTVRRWVPAEADFFVHALDDTLALTRSGSRLLLVDTRSGATLRHASIQGAWHFAVSEARDLVAVLAFSEVEAEALVLVSLSTFEEVGRIQLHELASAQVVAFDPNEEKIYVVGQRGRGDESHFVLVDTTSRSVLLSLPLGPGACRWFCVANPTATAPSGRYVAMEQGGGVYFIDTALDLPRYYTGFRSGLAGMSVAASPVEDAFYLLRSDGLLAKVRLEP